jgi:hypothetical protein
MEFQHCTGTAQQNYTFSGYIKSSETAEALIGAMSQICFSLAINSL